MCSSLGMSPGAQHSSRHRRGHRQLCVCCPASKGPGLCRCVSLLLLSTLRPGPGLLQNSSSGTPGQWTQEALGRAGLPGSRMECVPSASHLCPGACGGHTGPCDFKQNTKCFTMGRKPLLQSPPTPQNPQGSSVTKGLWRGKSLRMGRTSLQPWTAPSPRCPKGSAAGRLPDPELPGKGWGSADSSQTPSNHSLLCCDPG